MEPSIIYEDNDIIVLHKPSGITVNKADTTQGEMTVQDWIEKRLELEASNISLPWNEFVNRAGIVHRLDKETSGILLVAKNAESFINLQKQFKERTVKKIYIALAHGRVIPEKGEINVPVGRLSFNRKRFGVTAGGREAVTKYKTISNFKFQTSLPCLPAGKVSNFKKEEVLSLLEIYPQTGRTHQIRVHVKYINHPIVGDELYAGRKTARDDRKYVSRLFLHASKITFIHPTQNREVTFESRLPWELQEFLDRLDRNI